MPNFIENNPVAAVVNYTLGIVAVAVTCTVFIVRDNRLSYAEAQLNAQKAISEQYRSKLDLQDKAIADLQAQLAEYKAWALSSTDAVPAIVPRIRELKEKISTLETANASLRENGGKSVISAPPKASSHKGVAYIDPALGYIVSVLSTDPDQTARLRLQLPDRPPFEEDNVKPGQQWPFTKDGKQYMLTVSSVSYLTDTVDLMLTTVY